MDEQPPFIIVYGSLISKSNISDYFGNEAVESAEIVDIDNYKRVFNTKVTVRSGGEESKAILNAQKHEGYSMNGIKVECADFEDFGRYAVREDGYRFRMVGSSIKEEFGTSRKFLMATDREVSESNILPHNEYLKSCIKSSRDWGADFHKRFMNSTYLTDGTRLRDYI